MSKYKAVFFDFGDTLIFDYPSIPVGLARLFRNMGFDVTDEEVQQARQAFNKKGIRSRNYPTLEQVGGFFRQLFRGILEELNFNGDMDSAVDRTEAEWRLYTNFYLFPEVEQVLNSLHERGCITGIISNISCRLPVYLEQLGITSHFKFAIASDVFGASKPDPSIFEEALRMAGVNASQAIHVGDSYAADIVGAKGVGITPVLIDRDDQHPEADCHRINSLLMLLEML